MATNKPVKITDSNSGIMRRLIDIHPTGKKIKSSEYEVLMERIPFELGEIANKCLKVYRELGKNYYKNYIPMDMVQKTDVFFNFIDENYETFLSQDNMSLKQAYDMYKTYCDESALEFVMPKYTLLYEDLEIGFTPNMIDKIKVLEIKFKFTFREVNYYKSEIDSLFIDIVFYIRVPDRVRGICLARCDDFIINIRYPYIMRDNNKDQG